MHLVQHGGSQTTAFRQICRYFRGRRAGELLPDADEARIRLVAAAEHGIAQIVAGRKGNLSSLLRLYGEATGVVEPEGSSDADEGERLRLAAEAILRIRGIVDDSGTDPVQSSADG